MRIFYRCVVERRPAFVATSAALMTSLLALSACKPAAGGHRQDCYPNDTCNAGLVCAGGTCVQAESERESSTSADAPSASAAEQDSGAAVARAIEDALRTYRAHYNAWNNHNADDYFAGYAPVLNCYYNDAQTPVEKLINSSRGRHFREHGSTVLGVGTLDVLQASENIVVFRDKGTYTDKGKQREHDKIIAMQRLDGRWRITVEASSSAHRCDLPDAPAARRRSADATSPPTPSRLPTCQEFVQCYTRCDELHEDSVMECRDRCDARFGQPGEEPNCQSAYNPRTQPCEAAAECRTLCISSCPGAACNGAQECESACDERFPARCGRRY